MWGCALQCATIFKSISQDCVHKTMALPATPPDFPELIQDLGSVLNDSHKLNFMEYIIVHNVSYALVQDMHQISDQAEIIQTTVTDNFYPEIT